MDTVEHPLDIPTSLSAVFDSSDEDDPAASQAPNSALTREFKGPKAKLLNTSDAAAIVTPELLRLADEYREAGLTARLTPLLMLHTD